MKRRLMYLLLCFICLPSVATLERYRVATWNLQGSSAANESKWNINVRQLLIGDQSADILMVQEAGTLPASARRTQRTVQPVGVGIPIDEYVWNLGTARRPDLVYIYYSRLDVGANRVNLAIVSRFRADDVYVIDSGVPVLTARPAVGIRIGNDVFLGAHALARRGTDAPRLVQSVYRFFATDERRHLSWLMAGDFNRSPNSLQNALRTEPSVDQNTLIIAPTEPTHRSGNILDYAILHNATHSRHPVRPPRSRISASIMFNQVRSQIASDHYPVSFVRDR